MLVHLDRKGSGPRLPAGRAEGVELISKAESKGERVKAGWAEEREPEGEGVEERD